MFLLIKAITCESVVSLPEEKSDVIIFQYFVEIVKNAKIAKMISLAR